MAMTARSVLRVFAALAAAASLAGPAVAAGEGRRDGKRPQATYVTNKIYVNNGRRLSPENERALVNMTLLRETVRMQQRSGARRCAGAIDAAAADCAIPSGARVVGAGAR